MICAFLAGNAHAQQSLQPGFFSHEPDEVAIRIAGARSGEVCSGVDGAASVCGAVSKIVVTGRETCNGPNGNQYPCTRFGYQFDCSGVAPGVAIECHAKRQDAFRRSQTRDYTLELDANEGNIFYPTWIAYEPVAQRVMPTEVHESDYHGARLVTIEFAISYEPSASAAAATSAAGSDEPTFAEIPNACEYLPAPAARILLRVAGVRACSANEHIPTFWSQCVYSAVGVSGSTVGFVFKFMLYDLFDAANLDPLQLDFNATFTGGGDKLVEKLEDLGKVAFMFEKRDRTMLMVVAGIKGPPDGVQRPTEFVANYYLEDPDTTHAARLGKLQALAEDHLREWHGR